MYVISSNAQKGGTGKTTLILSLYTAALASGLRAAVIDLDPQATACRWADRRKLRLPDAETLVFDSQPPRIPNAIQTAREHGIDIVLVDTPPRSSDAALAAARVADLVLIPCRPQYYDLETIPAVADILRLAGDKPSLAVLNAIPARGDRHHQAARALEGQGIPVCPRAFAARAAFGDAGAIGLSALELEPDGKAALEIRQVYKHVFGVVGNPASRDDGKSTSRKRRAA